MSIALFVLAGMTVVHQRRTRRRRGDRKLVLRRLHAELNVQQNPVARDAGAMENAPDHAESPSHGAAIGGRRRLGPFVGLTGTGAPATTGAGLEADLRAALEGDDGQLVLHYQPVVDLTFGRVLAVESLLRWKHPVRGILDPAEFLPMAEETGLIDPLGEWVLDRATRDAKFMTHQGRELDVAVNVSARQLDDQMVSKVCAALQRNGLRPGRLVLEVTESALVEDMKVTADRLDSLSRLGVGIAIDDFGTGFSTLRSLRQYPVNALKIDGEFVSGLGAPTDDRSICEGIIHLASALGVVTIAEGVETIEQYAVLRSLGCSRGQGFLWSPPVPIEALDAALVVCEAV